MKDLKAIIEGYNPNIPIASASTIPASWYTNERIFRLEKETVFGHSWQFAARLDQLRESGNYVTTEIAGEPIVIVRGSDGKVRGFFNVCRHHAAAVMTEAAGHANQMRCPYHGWTYSLEGELKGTPDFSGVCEFDRANNGLVPVELGTWGNWVFARLDGGPSPAPGSSQNSLNEFLGSDLIARFRVLDISNLSWFEQRRYTLNCNWKVFVDNYLDGGYHVPHLHKGLDSVLNYSNYMIENGEHFCLQSSPMVGAKENDKISAVRTGKRALYY